MMEKSFSEAEYQKLMSALSFSKKANKLLIGFDTVKEAMAEHKVKLLVFANNLSAKTKKEALYLGDKHHVKAITVPFSMDELWYLLDRKAGILAVIDKGFAEKIELLTGLCESCL